ncbi:nucleotidyltransferase domain-containing protein [Luteipulveratus flavus]|uniref:DUF4111 domain-containing protein n=1 Tax=Luteipulveratus flavus TaxID=3031728 RepID=A0ABT6CBV9_9MICO|nr:nucleotidyltransferase domain-containing protein [Luteipulveratus sp. YIM 133296]MDF8266388.1 DUF4111 domain-containing protein [Luteipulveratus sp. YIM 133296]
MTITPATAPLLPARVRDTTDAALARVDAALEGTGARLVGLYLHGSLCWGEFFAGSDVDFVGVLDRRADTDVIEALRHAHEAIAAEPARPAYDGFYVTEADLARPPADLADHPGVLAGTFAVGRTGDANLVTWHELAERGITVRGRDAAELDVWTSMPALQAYSRANLEAYWLGQVSGLEADKPVLASDSEWCVLGIARLHHALQTGAITSKSGAGRWALEVLDERHHPVVHEALAHRESGASDAAYDADPEVRRRAVVAVMREVLGEYGL